MKRSLASVSIAAVLALGLLSTTAVVPTRAQGGGLPTPVFDEETAEGSGLIGDHPVSILEMPEGCTPLPGMVPYGRFAVNIPYCASFGGNTVCAWFEAMCADYGDTVSNQGVAVVFGSPGDDILDQARIPSGHHALVFGFDGNDVITPQDGNVENYVIAGGGSDEVSAPVANGDYGATIFGGEDRSPRLEGTAGDDTIVGGSLGDTLIGGNGIDELYGSGGNDSLNACNDAAPDYLEGGSGFDTFVVEFLEGFVLDNVLDWERAEPVVACP